MKATFLSIVFLVLAVVVSATTHNQTTSSKHHNNSTAIAITKARSQNYIIQIRRESKLEECKDDRYPYADLSFASSRYILD